MRNERCVLHAFAAFGCAALLGACSVAESGMPASDGVSTSAGGTSAGGTGAGALGGGGAGASEGGAGGAEEPPINEGFIGGPCASVEDCSYEGAICLTEQQGFPDGMCSLDCQQYCPDGEGMVTTFCATPEDLGTTAAEGLCTTRCDYGVSPTGCRPGYQCHAIARFNDPAVIVYACVPGEDSPFELGACHQELLAQGIGFSPAVNPMDHPDGHPELTCDIVDPIYIAPVLHDVVYRPTSLDADPSAVFTACLHGLAMAGAAAVAAAAGTTDIVHWGVYNCRVIAGTSTLSQHGLANAIDFRGFGLSGGAYYTVFDDWEHDTADPVTEAGQFLKDFAQALYDGYIYNIILTPDYNAAHDDHFHCDLTEGAHYLP